MANKQPQQSGLNSYRARKKQETVSRVEDAVKYLKEHRKTVNINSVANQSGVSSVTIYKYPELIKLIKGSKSTASRPRPEGNSNNVAQMQVIIDGLRLKNEELIKENELLKKRIEIQNGEIYELRHKQS